METTLTGPILYLLIVWGVITVVFIGLLDVAEPASQP